VRELGEKSAREVIPPDLITFSPSNDHLGLGECTQAGRGVGKGPKKYEERGGKREGAKATSQRFFHENFYVEVTRCLGGKGIGPEERKLQKGVGKSR